MENNNGILKSWKKIIGNIGFFRQVREINKKYATPKLQMTPTVKFALLILRIYLIVLVLLLGIRFFTLLNGGLNGGTP